MGASHKSFFTATVSPDASPSIAPISVMLFNLKPLSIPQRSAPTHETLTGDNRLRIARWLQQSDAHSRRSMRKRLRRLVLWARELTVPLCTRNRSTCLCKPMGDPIRTASCLARNQWIGAAGGSVSAVNHKSRTECIAIESSGAYRKS